MVRRVGLAIFVVAHVFIVTLMAVPKPHISDKDLASEHVNEWFDRVHATVSGVGIPVARDTLKDRLVDIARAWVGFRDVMLVPGRAYARWTGTHQSWAMFGGIPNHAGELVMSVEEDGRWREVFVTRQHGLDWQRPVLDQERWRSYQHQFVRKKNRKSYKRYSAWLAERAATDFPTAQAFRVQVRRVELPPADALVELGELPRGEVWWTETHELADYRGVP